MGLHQSRWRQEVSGTSPDTGRGQNILPREWVGGPQHEGGSAGTAPPDGSGDPAPTPGPPKPQEYHDCCSALQKGHRGNPDNSQSWWPAAGNTHPADLSLRRDWGRLPLTPGATERTCLQAGQVGLVAGQPQCGPPPKIPSLWLPIAPANPTGPPQGLAPSWLWRLIQGWAGPQDRLCPHSARPQLTHSLNASSSPALLCSLCPSASPWPMGSAGPKMEPQSPEMSFLG